MSSVNSEFEYFQYIQIFGLGLITILIFKLLSRRTSLNEPPLVPYKYPIIGHTFEYYRDVPSFLKKCHEEYGEIFSLYIWGKVETYVGNEFFPEIIKKNQEFSSHEAFNDRFPIDTFLGRPHNYFVPFIEYVKEYFYNLDRIIEREQIEVINSLDELICDKKVIQPPLATLRQIIARPIIATIAEDEKLRNDKDLLNTAANITAELGPWLSAPPVLNFIYNGLHRKFITFLFRYFNNPIKSHRKLIISKITPVINQRIADQKKFGDSWKRPDDAMQLYIERSMDSENNVDARRVADFIMVTIVSSVFNTSSTVAQCIVAYINNPEYQKELLEEAEMIHNESKLLTGDGVNKMEKLDNFIKEAMRINRHDVSLSRKVLKDSTFSNGYQVPKGRTVHVITRHVHYNTKGYGPNPEKFYPYHHGKSPASRPERYFLAFGMGKQACPGRFYAVNNMKIVLHQIFLNYDIKSASGKYITQKKRGGFVLVSDDPITFEKKKNSL